VKGYESKFMPLEGKIRIVTINYDFPGRSSWAFSLLYLL
jgi:hypothetical protein